MAEVRFSTKKEPTIIKEDKSWYKPYCQKCPYLVRVEFFDNKEENKIAIRCMRPTNKDCLALSPLVSTFVMTEMYNQVKREVEAKEEPKPIVVGAATKKRRMKIHKKRR